MTTKKYFINQLLFNKSVSKDLLDRIKIRQVYMDDYMVIQEDNLYHKYYSNSITPEVMNKDEFDILWKISNLKLDITRYKLNEWNLDYYNNLTGIFSGLIIAHIILKEDNNFYLPLWLGKEIINQPSLEDGMLINFTKDIK